jgi:RHS repeat-associated protein
LQYDDADRLTGITHTGSMAGPLSAFTYGYDDADRLTSYTGPEGSKTYGYDDTDQLVSVTGVNPESFDYDANGNRDLAGYVTDPGNRLRTDGTFNYTYDDEGNTLTQTRVSDGQVTTFTWDHRNRQTTAEIRTSGGTLLHEERYTYDVFDRRIGVWVGADGAGAGAGVQTWTLYDGANAWADFDANGSLTTRYLNGLGMDERYVRVSASGNAAWYLTDHLGSVRQVVSPTGIVLDAVTYSAFGTILAETNPSAGDRFKYTGREWDAGTGQYYYRARYYGAGAGRFRSEDPIGFAAGDPNLYRYVGNNTTTSTDPTGEVNWGFVALAALAAFIVVGTAGLGAAAVGVGVGVVYTGVGVGTVAGGIAGAYAETPGQAVGYGATAGAATAVVFFARPIATAVAVDEALPPTTPYRGPFRPPSNLEPPYSGPRGLPPGSS